MMNSSPLRDDLQTALSTLYHAVQASSATFDAGVRCQLRFLPAHAILLHPLVQSLIRRCATAPRTPFVIVFPPPLWISRAEE